MRYLMLLVLLLPLEAAGQMIIRRAGAAENSPGTADLISWWDCDQDGVDQHGTNDVTLTGVGYANAAPVSAGLGYYCDDDSKASGNDWSLAFASAGGLYFGDESFSVCFWSYPEDLDADTELTNGFYNGASDANWLFWDDTDFTGNTRFSTYGAAQYDVTADANNELQGNAWNLVCGGYENGVELWIKVCNSVEGCSQAATTAAQTNDPTAPTAADYVFGSSHQDGGTGYIGHLDELCVFNDRLTDAEVQWLYNNGSGRSYSDL